MPGTHVTTTVQIFIVVVSAATAVATTLQKFIVVVSAATAVSYDSIQVYRDDDDDDDDDEEEEGAKRSFKIAENRV